MPPFRRRPQPVSRAASRSDPVPSTSPPRLVAHLALAVLCLVGGTACAGDGHGVVDPLSGNPSLFTWALPAGVSPPPVPTDNPMSAAKVELGRRLFYDTRLSGNGGFSCASCHRQEFAFADAKNIPLGSTGEPHPRNSMALANAGYQSFLNWANTATTTLEAQALVPMFGDRPVELGLKGGDVALLERLRGEPLYRQLFPKSFPGEPDPVSVANVTKALAAFQRTLLSFNAPFDRTRRGESAGMSAAALRGEALFRSSRLKCAECHAGTLFTSAADAGGSTFSSLQFFNTGLYNVGGAGAYPARNRGLFEITGNAQDMGRFKVPSLRNLAFTFPYMHDGSISSLEDVVDHYARGGRIVALGPNAGDGHLNPFKDARVAGFAITPEEKGDLVAFLRSLSDSSFVREGRFSNPWNR